MHVQKLLLHRFQHPLPGTMRHCAMILCIPLMGVKATSPFCAKLPWAQPGLRSQDLLFPYILAFLCKVGAGTLWPLLFPAAHPPEAQAAPRGRSKLSLCAPSCSVHAAHRCWGSSGSAAKPTLTGHWVPMSINVVCTAHPGMPHGLQAVSFWLKAQKEMTHTSWPAGTSSPALDQTGQ